MREIRVRTGYRPLPRQEAFHRSVAKAKGYGGAMGGGKSRALCEEAFQAALDYPGIEIVVARQEHTAIFKTTRKTMFREVLPASLVKHCRVIKSGGEDFVEFPNGSVIHFAGLDDPVKWHSSEIGLLVLDEAHQIDEDAVMTLNTRLRQKCAACLAAADPEKKCPHMPRRILAGFNPENPGHWLYRWFIDGADKTELGYYKPELRLDEDSNPIGDAEFVEARATDNPYLPEGYILRELGGMKEFHRRRYLEGEWLFVSGRCFFDQERLADYSTDPPGVVRRFDFEVTPDGSRARRREHDLGKIRVYRDPEEGHQYAVGCDVSTGRGLDYSCAYVIDLDDMAPVCEFRGKLDADQYAEQLHFLGRWYNTALIAVESAGGWGEPVVISLRDGKGGRPAYPKQYRHRLDAQVNMDTVSRYGYPINTRTRPQVLNQLEKAVRERSLPWMPPHLVNECHTFCEFEEKTPSPRAQPGCNDDAVMAAAITLELYRQKGRHVLREGRIRRRKTETERRKLREEREWAREQQSEYDEMLVPAGKKRSRAWYPWERAA